MKYFIAVALASVTLAGCATGLSNLKQLRPGMAPSEVTAIMGDRDSFATVNKNGVDYTAYQYTNRQCDTWTADKCDFVVVFQDGKLAMAKVADVRQYQPANSMGLIGLQLLKMSQPAPISTPATTSCMAQPNGRQMNCTTW